MGSWAREGSPLGFEFLEDLPLGVIAYDLDIDEAAQIELFGPKHGHLGGVEAVDYLCSRSRLLARSWS